MPQYFVIQLNWNVVTNLWLLNIDSRNDYIDLDNRISAHKGKHGGGFAVVGNSTLFGDLIQ